MHFAPAINPSTMFTCCKYTMLKTFRNYSPGISGLCFIKSHVIDIFSGLQQIKISKHIKSFKSWFGQHFSTKCLEKHFKTHHFIMVVFDPLSLGPFLVQPYLFGVPATAVPAPSGTAHFHATSGSNDADITHRYIFFSWWNMWRIYACFWDMTLEKKHVLFQSVWLWPVSTRSDWAKKSILEAELPSMALGGTSLWKPQVKTSNDWITTCTLRRPSKKDLFISFYPIRSDDCLRSTKYNIQQTNVAL